MKTHKLHIHCLLLDEVLGCAVILLEECLRHCLNTYTYVYVYICVYKPNLLTWSILWDGNSYEGLKTTQTVPFNYFVITNSDCTSEMLLAHGWWEAVDETLLPAAEQSRLRRFSVSVALMAGVDVGARRKSSWGPWWLSLGLDKVYDGRRDHTKKDMTGKDNSGTWNTKTCLGQYFASVIKTGRVEAAPELDTSPEPNRLITALHPTIPVFEVMHVKCDSNWEKTTIYGQCNRCSICHYAVSKADVVANTNPWKIEWITASVNGFLRNLLYSC